LAGALRNQGFFCVQNGGDKEGVLSSVENFLMIAALLPKKIL